MNDEPTLEELIAELGGSPAPAPATPTDPPPADPPAGDTPPADTPPAGEPQPADPNAAKAQQAFIHMRQQNKQLNDTLKGVAELLGLDAAAINDETKLQAALQNRITENQAAKAQVPVELLQRLQTLEARDQEYTAFQQRQMVNNGVQKLQTELKLSGDQVTSFMEELLESGVNPLTQSVDLVKEYRSMHFQELIQQEVAAAVRAEQERAARAGNQSTTPQPKQGDSRLTQPGGKVNSVQQLESYFSSFQKR